TTVIAQAMGGGQPEDTSARNPRVAGQHPQPSPRGHVVIFLPALNEERAIGHVLQRIPKAQLEAAGYTVSVWVVDGNSTDRTLEVIRKSGASVFVQTGRGKGNGMRQAFDHLLRSRDRADGGSLEAGGFDLEADLFGSAALKEARITELPIDYAARIGPPKLIPLRTGLKIALRLFKRRLNGPSTSPEHRSKPSRSSTTS